MKVVQINILKDIRSTGRTTIELHNFLMSKGIDSYIAYGIGDKSNDPRFYKISTKLDYYGHNVLSRITKKEGFYSKLRTKKLVKWLDGIKPDVVHVRNIHESYINLNILFTYLKKIGCKVAFTTHDFWLWTGLCPYPKANCNILECDKCGGAYKKAFELKKKLLLDLNNPFIQCNSKFSESIVKQSYMKDCEAKVIYNWIDFKKFYPESVDNVFNISNDKPVVLVIWSLLDPNLDRFKFFVKIADLLHEKYNFVMVGKHTFKDEEYPNIHFIQETNSTDQLRNFYSSADVFFNPSTTDTFGKVAAEAISCGTPIVVFDNQALPEIVGDNECGMKVEPFNVEQTVDAIESVIKNGKDLYAKKCFDRSRKLFDYETNCEEILESYR